MQRTALGRGKPLDSKVLEALVNLRSIWGIAIAGTHGLNEELGRQSDRDGSVEYFMYIVWC